MDLDRLGMGEKIAAVAAFLLFIFMFFDWFSVSVSGGGFSTGSLGGGSAWDALDWIPWFLMITIVVAIGHALIEASDTDLDAPLHGSTATTVLGAISVLLILYRIVDTPGGGSFVGGSVDVSPTVGIFLSLIAAAGIAYGGYRGMQEADTSFSDAADRFAGAGGADPGHGQGQPAAAPPPPPPPPPPPAAPTETQPPQQQPPPPQQPPPGGGVQ